MILNTQKVVYYKQEYVLATEKQIKIKGTSMTPEVEFDGLRGSFTVKGDSVQLEIADFYAPILRTVDEYLILRNTITCNFVMRRLNTSTAKIFFDMFRHFAKLQSRGREIKVNWIVRSDDQTMIETGKDMKELFELDFRIVKLNK